MSDTTAPAPPRWPTYLGLLGTLITIGGLLMATGAWRQKTDDLDRRLTIVENIQRTNLPAFYGMQTDLRYLADRARRDDDRASREQR